jgi:AcrR family transcriptional regulator
MSRAMTGSDDPRAVRTRAALRAAFDELVRDRAPSEMSVAALTRAAGISRTSFYEHYASPEDLALDALDELFATLRDLDIGYRGSDAVSPGEATRRAISALVAYVGARRATYARLLGPGAAPKVHAEVVAAYAEHATSALAAAPGRPAGADAAVTARFLAGGVLTVLGAWLQEPADAQPDADALVDALVGAMPAWLTD